MVLQAASLSVRSGARRILFRNVGALYVLQIAGYVLPFVSIPVLVRALGAEGYGRLVFAQAMTMYVVFLVDAGFNSSALRMVSASAHERRFVSEVYWGTQFIKVALAVLGLVLLNWTIYGHESLLVDRDVFYGQMLMVLGTISMPTWLFTALERLEAVATCEMFGRLVSVCSIAIFIRSPDDLVLASFLQGGATLLSGILAHAIWVRGMVSLGGAAPSVVLRLARAGKSYFFAELVRSISSNSTLVVLSGVIDRHGVGVFASLEKLIRAARAGLTPVATAVFPRVVRGLADDRAAGLRYAWKCTGMLFAAGVVAAAGISLFGEWVLHTAFGAEMAAYSGILVILTGWLALNTLTVTLGQLLLLAGGYAKGFLILNVTSNLISLLGVIWFTRTSGLEGAAAGMLLGEAFAGIALIPILWSLKLYWQSQKTGD